MRVFLTNTGSYPRVGDAPSLQVLRKTQDLWEKGEKTEQDLKKAQEDVTRDAILEQESAGLDLVTDGQIRWYDPVSHLCRKLKGVEINGLLRFFDTNFYFRQPVIKQTISANGSSSEGLVVSDYRFAVSVARAGVKPVLTGPYTLSKLSVTKASPYQSLDKLCEDMTNIIAGEVTKLSNEGAPVIQIDEPAILKNPDDFEVLKRCVSALSAKKGKSRLALYTYFADAAPLYEKFQTLDADIIGLDFTYGTDLANKVSSAGSGKILGLGIFDARNTRLEDTNETCKLLEKLTKKLKADTVYLNPSCGLEYLPRDKAKAKLARMEEVRKAVVGGQ